MKALHGLLIVVGVALVGGLLYLGSFRSRPKEGFFSGVVETRGGKTRPGGESLSCRLCLARFRARGEGGQS